MNSKIVVQQIDWVGEKRPRGRPRIYESKQEQQAEASRRYRARKKAGRQQAPADELPHSKIIDLSELPPWKRK